MTKDATRRRDWSQEKEDLIRTACYSRFNPNGNKNLFENSQTEFFIVGKRTFLCQKNYVKYN